MKWTEEYRICSHDTDMTGCVRAAAYMRFMQETAYRHMAAAGPSAETLREAGRAFLLCRITLSVYKSLRQGDIIEDVTWANESAGVNFGRSFNVYHNNMLAAEAQSVWMLYDFINGHILRAQEVQLNYGTDEVLELELPRRLSLPDGVEPTLEGVRTAEYADIDENRHVNNTVYADLLCGRTPEIASGDAHISSLYINFCNQWRCDEEIRIYRAQSDGIYYFKTLRPDGRVNIEAKIIAE